MMIYGEKRAAYNREIANFQKNQEREKEWVRWMAEEWDCNKDFDEFRTKFWAENELQKIQEYNAVPTAD